MVLKPGDEKILTACPPGIVALTTPTCGGITAALSGGKSHESSVTELKHD